MDNLEFTAIIAITFILAGLLGSLTRLGGVVVSPITFKCSGWIRRDADSRSAPWLARYRFWKADQQVEITISVLLRVGVTLAAALVVVGGIIYLIHNIPEDHIFRGKPTDLRQVPGVLNDVLALEGWGIINSAFCY